MKTDKSEPRELEAPFSSKEKVGFQKNDLFCRRFAFFVKDNDDYVLTVNQAYSLLIEADKTISELVRNQNKALAQAEARGREKGIKDFINYLKFHTNTQGFIAGLTHQGLYRIGARIARGSKKE